LKFLIENDVLPIEIEKEIEFDSYGETRELYEKIKNGR
jgi:hypothetical protein